MDCVILYHFQSVLHTMGNVPFTYLCQEVHFLLIYPFSTPQSSTKCVSICMWSDSLHYILPLLPIGDLEKLLLSSSSSLPLFTSLCQCLIHPHLSIFVCHGSNCFLSFGDCGLTWLLLPV